MNNKRLSTMIALALIIILLVVIGIISYLPKETSSSPQIIEKEVSPLETKTCKIDLYPDAKLTLKVNQTYELNAYNAQGSMMDLYWVSKNPSVVSFREHLGDVVTLIAYNPGDTEVIVTDRSIGEDCTDYLFVEVRE